jgi:hypothetical protein
MVFNIFYLCLFLVIVLKASYRLPNHLALLYSVQTVNVIEWLG